MPAGTACVNMAVSEPAGAQANGFYTCGRCNTNGVIYQTSTAAANNNAAVPQTCTATVNGSDANCVWWSTNNATAALANITCHQCAANSALRSANRTGAASCVTIDATKLANCYIANAAGTDCAQCLSNAWMNGSGVCITAVPSSTTKASGLVSVIISTLLAVMILN